jgi:hypothetical protein
VGEPVNPAKGECAQPGCPRPAKSRQFCVTHYEYRRRRGEFAGVPAGVPVEQRYEAYIDRSPGRDACHLWTGSVNEDGYALLKIDGKTRQVHRWAYQRFVGPLAPGEVVRHTCDTPACHNRSHWRPGTQADNMRDCVERGRFADNRGSRNPRAKLTEADVRVIRTSPEPISALARRYGVSRFAVRQARSGGTWSHLPAVTG